MSRYKFLINVIGALALAIVLASTLALPALAQDSGGKFVISEDFVLKSGETLEGGLSVISGSATLEKDSRVDGDVFIAGGNVRIAGTVNGDVAIVGGDVRLTSTAVVTGDVTSLGGDVRRDDGATVQGKISSSTGNVPIPRLPSFWRSFSPFTNIPTVAWGGLSGFWSFVQWVFSGVISAIGIAALALLIVLLLEKPVRATGNTLLAFPWASLGMGLLTLVAVLAISVILTITLCLIPLAVALLLATCVALLLGWAVAGLLVGERILQALKVHDFSPLLAAGIGVVLLTLISRLPCVGWAVGVVVGAAGLGAVVLTRAGTRPYPRPALPPALPAMPTPPGPPAPPAFDAAEAMAAEPTPPSPADVQPGGPADTPPAP